MTLTRAALGLALALLAASARAAPPAKAPPTRLGLTAKYTFVAYGDTRSDPAAHARVIREIIGLHPEFVLQSGDLVDNGRDPAQWAEFDRITRPLRDARIAYYPARGNHDRGTIYPRHVREPFDSGDKATRLFYAFTRHGSRFLMVDSEQSYAPGSRQYGWLARELARAQPLYANTFVMFHEGPYSIGPHGPTREAQEYLHPLFVRYKPRAVFCGHDHLYYRTVRDGVTYVVTGGGGAPPYEPDNLQVAIPGDVYVPDVDAAGRALDYKIYKPLIYHAIRCEVDGPRVTLTVIRPDGTVIDKFTLGPK